MINHYKWGRLSGYPSCCCLYFYLRLATLTIFGTRFVVFFTDRFGVQKGFVECPYHNIMIRLGKFKVRHHTCKECGWDQINKIKCNIRHLHNRNSVI